MTLQHSHMTPALSLPSASLQELPGESIGFSGILCPPRSLCHFCYFLIFLFSTLGKPNPPIALAPLQFYNQKNLLSYAMSLMSPPRHCGFSHQLPPGSPSSPRAPQVPLTSVYRELPRFLPEPGTGLRGSEQCLGSLCLGDKVELHRHTCCHSWGQMREYTAQSWSFWSLAELLFGLLFLPMVRLDRNMGPDL